MSHLEALISKLRCNTPSASGGVRFTVSVEAETVAVLDRFAERLGVSRSAIVRDVLAAVAADLDDGGRS